MNSYPLIFEPDFGQGRIYKRTLKARYPEAGAFRINTLSDRECIFFGKKMKLPPVSQLNSNKNIVNIFAQICLQEYCEQPVFVYPAEHFDILYENNFAVDTVPPKDYRKSFYDWFKKNDLNPMQKQVLVFPINYGHVWHLVAVDKPFHAILKGKEANVYLVSAHKTTPQYALGKVVTKYLEVAFTVLGYNTYPANFKYQELLLEEHADQGQVLCCVYMELVFKIMEARKGMTSFFSGIKVESKRLKFQHQIFGRFIQTMINCFDVENNPYGQIPSFDVLVLETEDLSWIPNEDIDRILNPRRHTRVVRPLRHFALPDQPVERVIPEQYNIRGDARPAEVRAQGPPRARGGPWEGDVPIRRRLPQRFNRNALLDIPRYEYRQYMGLGPGGAVGQGAEGVVGQRVAGARGHGSAGIPRALNEGAGLANGRRDAGAGGQEVAGAIGQGATGAGGAGGQGVAGPTGQGAGGARSQGTAGAGGQGVAGPIGQGATGARGQGTTGAGNQGTAGVRRQGAAEAENPRPPKRPAT